MQPAYLHCEALVREQDRDRYLASLFAPADRRPHLHALYAFDIEVARIGHVVREALAGRVPGEVAAHPVASALMDTIAQCGLPTDPLDRLIDARALDLYDDPLSSLDELVDHARQTASTVLDLAARILDRDAGVADVAGPAGLPVVFVALLLRAA